MVNQSGHNALTRSGRVSVKFWRAVANCVFDRRLLTVSLTVACPFPHNSLLHTQLKMAPEVGLEPTTSRLTAARSTIELLWNPKGVKVNKPAKGASNRFVKQTGAIGAT